MIYIYIYIEREREAGCSSYGGFAMLTQTGLTNVHLSIRNLNFNMQVSESAYSDSA